jgi:GNAT superfamily N-acetyltransferase
MDVIPSDQDLQPLITGITTRSTPELEQQLFNKSKQPNILKFTPKDAARRFGSQEMFETWKAGGRELYWLIGKDNDLAGVIWYGRKTFPLDVKLPETPAETFAVRLYDGYTGHGLAVPAMRQTLRLHVQAARERGEKIAGIWLETDTDNPAALKVYTNLGYQEVYRNDERVTMVLPASKIPDIIEK